MEEIANGSAYEGRVDLGNTQTWDGQQFKGRGLFQLTGRGNYTKFETYLRNNVSDYSSISITRGDENPKKVATDPFLAAYSAGWYWKYGKTASDGSSKLEESAVVMTYFGYL